MSEVKRTRLDSAKHQHRTKKLLDGQRAAPKIERKILRKSTRNRPTIDEKSIKIDEESILGGFKRSGTPRGR